MTGRFSPMGKNLGIAGFEFTRGITGNLCRTSARGLVNTGIGEDASKSGHIFAGSAMFRHESHAISPRTTPQRSIFVHGIFRPAKLAAGLHFGVMR